MSVTAFLDSITHVPRPASPEDGATGMASLAARLKLSEVQEQALTLDAIRQHPKGIALLHCLFGHSPFLTRLVLQDIVFFARLCRDGPDQLLAEVLAQLQPRSCAGTELMKALRRAKSRGSLLIAVADLTSRWPLEQVTRAMSELAEQCVQRATAFLLAEAQARNEIVLADAADPERGSGLIVLAMGKLGTRDLNYSSDIDLIIFFDRERVRYTGTQPIERFFPRLAQNLVRILQERTAEGYAFRVDLRLRPDPASTLAAMPTAGALAYYETVGQNWERAALIKARPIAGDYDAAFAFLRQLAPFLWRKHLDFAAIDDIQSIKRQMDVRAGTAITIAGHNVKTGLGGIREIEFYAQIHQLIWGGRLPALRISGTCATLRALAKTGHITHELADRLSESYRFLRTVEHRLQMVDDQQTHAIPKDSHMQAKLAAFMDFPDLASFERALLGHLHFVHATFAESFRGQCALGNEQGTLSFTGTEDDAETLVTLRKMGFANAASVSRIIQGWHRGSRRATRTQRARELITEWTPRLLKALAATAHPDQAFIRFDDFLSRLPSGVQLFSLFNINPELLDLMALIMGCAPALAETLSKKPDLLDAVLGTDFYGELQSKSSLFQALSSQLILARDLEDEMDILRRFKNEKQFQAGIQLISHQISAADTGTYLSDIADTCITALMHRVEAHFSTQQHALEKDTLAVIAMGRLGARELTFGSDIDLVFVYATDCPGALANKLAQRFVGALTALTREGHLYEVDTRLRPSGRDGLLAVSAESFEKYLAESAWTFELMALTRARVISGDATLRTELERIIRRNLTRKREPEKLKRDIMELRARITREFGSENPWNLKYVHGGLMDLNFTAQYLVLQHAHTLPELIELGSGPVFEKLLVHGLIEREAGTALLKAHAFLNTLFALLRLCAVGILDETATPQGLQNLLASGLELADFPAVKNKLHDTLSGIRKISAAVLAPSQSA